MAGFLPFLVFPPILWGNWQKRENNLLEKKTGAKKREKIIY